MHAQRFARQKLCNQQRVAGEKNNYYGKEAKTLWPKANTHILINTYIKTHIYTHNRKLYLYVAAALLYIFRRHIR